MPLARAVTTAIRRTLADVMYAPRPYDPEQERAHAEQVLREQMEEWRHEEEHASDNEVFTYASAAGFDPHP